MVYVHKQEIPVDLEDIRKIRRSDVYQGIQGFFLRQERAVAGEKDTQ